MRLIIAVFALLATFTSAQASGYVTLNNVTAPYTNIEVGDEVSVVITGAPAYGTVTVTVDKGDGNGPGAPYTYGTTDASGNWSTTSTTMDSDWNFWAYTDRWYVNGVELTYVSNAYGGPELPTFYIYGTNVVYNCPGQSTFNFTRHWIWSPVEYESTALSIIAAASQWNYYVGDTIYLYNDTSEYVGIIVNYASIGDGIIGQTITYGQDSNDSCLNTEDACGNCMTNAVMYYAAMTLDTTAIAGLAEELGTDDDMLAIVATHEFGHALKLGHTDKLDGICSDVNSIMYPVQTSAFECGVTTPVSYCDAEVGIPSVYPEPVAAYCDYPDPYCGHGSCS